MTAKSQRFLLYPVAAAITAALLWAGFVFEAEADFGTLISSASLQAEIAAGIPADQPEGRRIRDELTREAHAFLERAERVEPNTSAACQVRALLAMIDGRHGEAAELYARARELDGCTPDQVGRLVMHEAKALSNAGRFDDALRLLARHEGDRRPEDGFAWDTLRVRVLFRAGREDVARSSAIAVAERAAPMSHECFAAASLLEDLGAYAAAEAAYAKSSDDNELNQYLVARLKLRAGETDTASSLLRQSVRTGDPEVLRQARLDEGLWIDALGTEGFEELTTSTGDPAAPGAGR